jgi:two-component sensor histidine kinase
MDLVLILIASVMAQLAASVYALSLIRLTGFRYSWLCISFAVFAMSIRRIIPLYSLLSDPEALCGMHYGFEALGLLLSLFMLAGVYGIRSIFRELKEAEEKVQELLDEKELILKEVHHRIKNNMNTISSMLGIQAAQAGLPETTAALEAARERIIAMSVLYDKLYRSDIFNAVSAQVYFSAMIDEILGSFPQGASVQLETDIADIVIEARLSMSLGIILNELITNALKYAVSPDKVNRLCIIMRAEGASLVCSVADTGPGMADSKQQGFGSTLIASLVKQHHGSMELDTKKGTRVVLRFPMA